MSTLLVIDGDSLAHRAYHALPKSIRGTGGRPANALVGFGNFLLRLWEAEQPRAVIVGWDTLDDADLPARGAPRYQSGREFDDALLEQLDALPQLVAAFGFACAKAPGYEADDFLAAAAPAKAAGPFSSRRRTATRSSSWVEARDRSSSRSRASASSRGSGLPRCASGTASSPAQVPDFIALRGDPSDRIPGARGVGPKKAADVLAARTLEEALAGAVRAERGRPRLYRRVATMDADAPPVSLTSTDLGGGGGARARPERAPARLERA